jgi:transcriptional regulator with XRE-family HTH domain
VPADPEPIRLTFGRASRDVRGRLGVTLEAVAATAGVSASYLARIEQGQVNPTFDTVERISAVLGLQLALDIRPPVFLGSPSTSDLVHAWCSTYVDRRLRAAGRLTGREVGLIDGRYRGWIDLLAFDPTTGSLLIIEIKTRLDDIGALERQLDWYEGSAAGLARERDWAVRSTRSVLLLLASEEIERSLHANRDALSVAFPLRAGVLDPTDDVRRGLALIDPRRRRNDWLMRSRVDGRRSIAPYRNYADAAARLARDAVGGRQVRPAAASIARAPADTKDPSEPSPMNRNPSSSSGGNAAAS